MISTTPTAMAAAVAAVVWTAPAPAQDLELPRQTIELVAPPFVHPHEQATVEGPKIIEVRMVAEEKEIGIDDRPLCVRYCERVGTACVGPNQQYASPEACRAVCELLEDLPEQSLVFGGSHGAKVALRRHACH